MVEMGIKGKQMIKQVIDEKNKQNQELKFLQDLKEYFKNYTLELSDELIMQLIKYEDESQGSKTVKKELIDEAKLTIGEPKELFKKRRSKKNGK